MKYVRVGLFLALFCNQGAVPALAQDQSSSSPDEANIVAEKPIGVARTGDGILESYALALRLDWIPQYTDDFTLMVENGNKPSGSGYDLCTN